MYSDDKTWKQHYEDWQRVLEKITGNGSGDEFRRKIIKNLIKDYESGHAQG